MCCANWFILICRCLKLYCQCFASSTTCGAKCKCESCKNTPQHAVEIDDARQLILDRNPAAFESHQPRHVPPPSAAPRFALNQGGAVTPLLAGPSYEPSNATGHYGAAAPTAHRMYPGRTEPYPPVPPHDYRGYGQSSYPAKYEGNGRRGSYDGTPYPPSHFPPPSVTPRTSLSSMASPPLGFHHERSASSVSHASVMLAQQTAAVTNAGLVVDSPATTARRVNRRNCKCRRSKCLKVRTTRER
jgi:Tesmin/TSO1-like CXC domain, cysteine-rich domain